MMNMNGTPFYTFSNRISLTIGTTYEISNCTAVTETLEFKKCSSLYIFSDKPTEIVVRWKPERRSDRENLNLLQGFEGKDVLVHFNNVGKDQYVIKGILDVVKADKEDKTITFYVM